ncbi:MAG: hypothetical protein AB7J46_04755 [Candidatus Altimarinota bacterium]
MAKNTYESEITLDGHLSAADYQCIQKKILRSMRPSTFFQFYLTLPEEILKKVSGHGIKPSNIEGTRLRFTLEDNRWEFVVKEQEEAPMKALRNPTRDALPAIIRKEHAIELTDREYQSLLKTNTITGLVIKQRFDLLKGFPGLFDELGLQPSEVTYDVVLAPQILIDVSEPTQLPFRLEAEFANPEDLKTFQAQHRQQFIRVLNRVFKPYDHFQPQKLFGQKIMAKANVQRLLSEGMCPLQIMKTLLDLSKRKKKIMWNDVDSSLPEDVFSMAIEMEDALRKSQKSLRR